MIFAFFLNVLLKCREDADCLFFSFFKAGKLLLVEV